MEAEIFHWIETNILPPNQLASETLHYVIVSKIDVRINTSNCSKAEMLSKEIRHKLTMENDIIYWILTNQSRMFEKRQQKVCMTIVHCGSQLHRNNSNLKCGYVKNKCPKCVEIKKVLAE